MAFAGCGLESIWLPSTLKVVETQTFLECANLNDVKFSEGLEKIGIEAFYKSGVESVTLPRSLRVLAQAAFARCENLKTVVLNEGLEVLGTNEHDINNDAMLGAFEDSTLENVHFPSTMKRIEYYTFSNCKNL